MPQHSSHVRAAEPMRMHAWQCCQPMPWQRIRHPAGRTAHSSGQPGCQCASAMRSAAQAAGVARGTGWPGCCTRSRRRAAQAADSTACTGRPGCRRVHAARRTAARAAGASVHELEGPGPALGLPPLLPLEGAALAVLPATRPRPTCSESSSKRVQREVAPARACLRPVPPRDASRACLLWCLLALCTSRRLLYVCVQLLTSNTRQGADSTGTRSDELLRSGPCRQGLCGRARICQLRALADTGAPARRAVPVC